MIRTRRRVYFVIGVDLDPTPGWGHEEKDWQQLIGMTFHGIEWYHPTVAQVEKSAIFPHLYVETGPKINLFKEDE